jgi:hypothetical protein
MIYKKSLNSDATKQWENSLISTFGTMIFCFKNFKPF